MPFFVGSMWLLFRLCFAFGCSSNFCLKNREAGERWNPTEQKGIDTAGRFAQDGQLANFSSLAARGSLPGVVFNLGSIQARNWIEKISQRKKNKEMNWKTFHCLGLCRYNAKVAEGIRMNWLPLQNWYTPLREIFTSAHRTEKFADNVSYYWLFCKWFKLSRDVFGVDFYS